MDWRMYNMAVNDWIDFLNPIAGLMSGTYLRGKKKQDDPNCEINSLVPRNPC